jgi:hypothetical protein
MISIRIISIELWTTRLCCNPYSNSFVSWFVLTRVLEPGDFVLAEKRCIEQYKFSHGDVILFK